MRHLFGKLPKTFQILIPILFITALVVVILFVTKSINKKGKMVSSSTEITIWINSDKGYDGLAMVGKKFENDTGVKVIVAHPDNLEEKYQQVAPTGDGPDIIFWAHDRFGQWAKAGLLAEVKPSAAFKDKIIGFAWNAVTYDNKYIGYPVAIESLSLIYNKDLISAPPTTWEEISAIDQRLKKENKSAIMWNLSEPYFTWPLLAADGGYAFEFQNGAYDPKDTGVNTPGAKGALQFIVNMIERKEISADVDYSIAESAFNTGQTAMTINGPWSWANMDKSGINYGVAVLPTYRNKSAKPFVGVLTAGINSASPHEALAKDFIENYLLTDEGLEFVNDDKPLGAVALKSYQEVLENDPRINATMSNAETGEVMPNIAEMSKFWYAESTAINNALQGLQSASDALDVAAESILKEDQAMQKL
ncbi:maltose/maltodextrin ABC transporter substrate-binding protein MalE [Psychromonas hadalis]|uniref:maltose/maltodextrin ABC transporter substrate-binding protein MalE n=1 Tax=Psychromonas hadalis TaxID=211669 RepID=UPI0003B64D0E|nr:maltose/maltodextrin ABC transporter substrate-binding protein MalE [Psychromonas hadalis]